MLVPGKKFLTIILSILFLPVFVMAQEPIEGVINVPAEYYSKAEVIEIVEQEYLGLDSEKQLFQTLKIRILSGEEKDKEITLDRVGGAAINGGQGFTLGDWVIVNKTTLNGETTYYLQDIYRVPSLVWAVVIFLAIVILFSRWRGLSSLLGLAITVVIILKFVAPQIIAGNNPLLICIIAAIGIVLTSLYLAHGFNKRTSVAVISTFITLGLSILIAYTFVHMSRLFGNGSEESFYLQFGTTGNINLQGLLLGAIILGALGVLDDITTAQSATVDELKKADPSMNFRQLYKSASSVGAEHISSLINTLFLAYAGVSLPLFLLFTTNSSTPFWVTLNSEMISEEIVRTLVGSITLILAVPITTLLAAYYFDKTGSSMAENHHRHS